MVNPAFRPSFKHVYLKILMTGKVERILVGLCGSCVHSPQKGV